MPSIHWLGSQRVSLSPSQWAISPCGSIGTLYSRGVLYSCSMRTGAVAKRSLGVTPFLGHHVDRIAFAGPRIVEARNRGSLLIGDLDEGCRCGRLLESLGNDSSNMLAAEGDVACQRLIGNSGRRRAGPVRGRLDRQGIVRCQDKQDAGICLRRCACRWQGSGRRRSCCQR